MMALTRRLCVLVLALSASSVYPKAAPKKKKAAAPQKPVTAASMRQKSVPTGQGGRPPPPRAEPNVLARGGNMSSIIDPLRWQFKYASNETGAAGDPWPGVIPRLRALDLSLIHI